MQKTKSSNNPTIEAILKSACGKLNDHLQFYQVAKEPKPSKFNNCKNVVDGITFDSMGEAERYGVLKMRRKAGEIGLIEYQVPYELNPGGTHSLKYIADFRYRLLSTGEEIVEDYKGFRTAVYKHKRRLMKKVYGIMILETSKQYKNAKRI